MTTVDESCIDLVYVVYVNPATGSPRSAQRGVTDIARLSLCVLAPWFRADRGEGEAVTARVSRSVDRARVTVRVRLRVAQCAHVPSCAWRLECGHAKSVGFLI
jgi:hypothetical protein